LRKPEPKEEEIFERREEIIKEKVDNTINKLIERKVDLVEDVFKYDKYLKANKKIKFQYKVPGEFLQTDEYKTYIEENPKKHVGPQHYFKTKPFNKHKKKKKADDDEGAKDNEEDKTEYIDRRVIDKKVYKPMKRHIF
jgi:hypothetical protein